jgi:type IV pilus assembly protein PilX
MIAQPCALPTRQRGIVLVTSLLLLLVVTIMALAMFRSFGIQEVIAGNTREKQRSLQAALTTQQYAEWWLANKSNAPVAVSGTSASSVDITCSTLLDSSVTTGATSPQICANSMATAGISPGTVPWTIGVLHRPAGMKIKGDAGCSTIGNDCYFTRPMFYVADAGQYGRMGELYQVDAYSYGVTPSTVTVVESTVAVTCIVCNPGTI